MIKEVQSKDGFAQTMKGLLPHSISNLTEKLFIKFEQGLLVADREDGDAGAVALEALVLDEDLGAVAIAASPPS